MQFPSNNEDIYTRPYLVKSQGGFVIIETVTGKAHIWPVSSVTKMEGPRNLFDLSAGREDEFDLEGLEV